LNYVHIKNYCYGKTTNERFAKKVSSSMASSLSSDTIMASRDESFFKSKDEERDAGKVKKSKKKGCWLNCKVMCCYKKVPTQRELLDQYE
jgi:hypothetical protein